MPYCVVEFYLHLPLLAGCPWRCHAQWDSRCIPWTSSHVAYNWRVVRTHVNSISHNITWWRHDTIETLSAALPLCEGNPPVTGGFPSQRTSAKELGVLLFVSFIKLWWASSRVVGDFRCHEMHECSIDSPHKWPVMWKALSISTPRGLTPECSCAVNLGNNFFGVLSFKISRTYHGYNDILHMPRQQCFCCNPFI